MTTEIKTWLTHEMLEYLKEHRFDGAWDEVAHSFNKEFGEKRSVDAVRLAFGRYGERDLSGREFSWWTRAAFDDVVEFSQKQGRYFVSGVMPINRIMKDGYEYTSNYVNMEAWRTVLHRFNTEEQRPVLLATNAHTRPLEKQPAHYDPAMTPWQQFFTGEATFNRHLRAVDMRLNPQQRKPLTSMELADLDNSVLLASPRQELRVIPTGNKTTPRILRSTGVMNYGGYQPNRMGQLADRAHRMGGLVLEVDGGMFHHRPVQFDANGGYYDLGQYIHHEGSTASRAEAIVFGDFHLELTTPGLVDVGVRLIKDTQPRAMLFHDPTDMPWCNPHIAPSDWHRMPEWMRDSSACRAVIRARMDILRAAAPADCKIYWVASNHGAGEGDFFARYVKSGRYTSDPITANAKAGHKAWLDLIDGRNPTAEWLDLPYITYLGEDEDLFIKGWQCANHGHKGVGGIRSKQAVARTASKVISGHTHEPSESENHIVVGHMSMDDHIYNRGGGRNWLQSSAVIQPSGHVQQILMIKKPNTEDTYTYRMGG